MSTHATKPTNATETVSHLGDRPLLGVTLLMGCLIAMAGISALVKLLGTDYPIQQLLMFRFGIAALIFLCLASRNGGVQALKTRRPFDHAVRTLCGIVSLSAYFYAITEIPIADASAISYAAPIFVVVLSIPFLGERIGLQRWLAVLAGFVGMLLIARPGVMSLEVGYIAAIASALFGAMVVVWLRRLAKTEKTITSGFYYNTTGALLAVGWVLLTGWTTPSATDLALLVLLGLLAGPQQYLLAASFRFAEASMLAPLDYAFLIFAAVIGYVFWGEVPTLITWIGCAIIAASGIFAAYRERVVSGRQKLQPPPVT